VNKSAVLGLLVALCVPLLGYFIVKGVSTDAAVMPRHYIYDSVITKTEKGKLLTDTVWHTLPDFRFTNQIGQQVGWQDLEGKVVVASFFFTRCPTICPRMTVNMKRLQDGITNAQRVGDKAPKWLHLLSFSVDPERDSVRDLKHWADRFGIDSYRWWLLTGPKKEIYDLSIEHMKVLAQDGKGVDTSFFHTDYFVLIDKNRNIRGYYHGLDTTAVAQLSRDIVLLSMEKDPKRKKFFEGKLELLAVVFLLSLVGLGIFLYFLKKEKKPNGTVTSQERP
jgi:protein SCO1/2